MMNNSPRGISDLYNDVTLFEPNIPYPTTTSLRSPFRSSVHSTTCPPAPKKMAQNNGTHFHIVVRQPTNEFLTELIDTCSQLQQVGFIQYVVLAEEHPNSDNHHVHIAIGLSRNQRKQTLVNKLKFFSNGQKKGWQSFYCQPIYQDSTPAANINYVKKDRNVLLELGAAPTTDQPTTKSKRKHDRDAECIDLAKKQKWDEIAEQHPGFWIRNGAKLKGTWYTS